MTNQFTEAQQLAWIADDDARVEAIQAALDAAEQRGDARGGQWQDISTAPKDGRWLLVHSVKWGDNPEVAQWSSYGDGWITMEHAVKPTHWMFLPAPPPQAASSPQEGSDTKNTKSV